jgi:hypothetical protein
MTLEFLSRNWALLIASVLGGSLLLFVLWRLWLQSPRGRLNEARKHLRVRVRESTRAERALRRGSRALASLEERAASIRPSRLEAAREAVEDARALAKIAHDQVLIAENLIREVIVEEFPPRQHESLRRRYLRPDEERGKPYRG